jgi:hypothetical protein
MTSCFAQILKISFSFTLEVLLYFSMVGQNLIVSLESNTHHKNLFVDSGEIAQTGRSRPKDFGRSTNLTVNQNNIK